MTRPTTDGDTTAQNNAWLIARVRDSLEELGIGVGYPQPAIDALDLIESRLSEQEVELERLREMLIVALGRPEGRDGGLVSLDLNASASSTTEDREG